MHAEYIDCIGVLDVDCIGEKQDVVEDLECMQVGEIDCLDESLEMIGSLGSMCVCVQVVDVSCICILDVDQQRHHDEDG